MMTDAHDGGVCTHMQVFLDDCVFRASTHPDGTTTIDIDGGAIVGLTAVFTPRALNAMRQVITPPQPVRVEPS